MLLSEGAFAGKQMNQLKKWSKFKKVFSVKSVESIGL